MEVKVDADNWKIICTVHCTTSDFDALRTALKEHLQIANMLEELLKKHAKAERYGLITVEVQSSQARMKEDDFFALVLSHPELHATAEQYVKGIVSHILKTNRPLWAEEDKPLGLFAAFRLALLAPGYVNLYADLLEVSDMDHEVFQEEQIDLLLKAHGLNLQTLRLLAIRATVASGQVGDKQMDRYRSSLATLFTAQPAMLAVFLADGLNALLSSYANVKPPMGLSRKQFYLSRLKPLLAFVADPVQARAWREQVKLEVQKMYDVIDEEKPAERGVPEADCLFFERNPKSTSEWRTINLTNCTRKDGMCLLGCDAIAQGEQNGEKSSIQLEYRTVERTCVLRATAGPNGVRQNTENIIKTKGDKLEFKLDVKYAGSSNDVLEFGFIDFLAYLEKEKVRQ